MPLQLETGERRIPRYDGQSVYQDAAIFSIHFLKNHHEKAADPRLMGLFDDLSHGFFWGILTYLDGPADPINADRRMTQEKRAEARAWTRDTFLDHELNELMDLTIDLALHPPAIEGRPGYVLGHSVLLSHMVDKPGSIFKEGVTEAGRKRLVNGAFWESLGDGTSQGYLQDLLIDHGQDLDPAFAGEGIKLYKRNRDLTTSSDVKLDTDMSRMATRALDTYKEFIDAVAKQQDGRGEPVVPPEQIDELLQPYILAVIAEDPDETGDLRFGPKFDIQRFVTVTPLDGYDRRLADPLVASSLARSVKNRTARLPKGWAKYLPVLGKEMKVP